MPPAPDIPAPTPAAKPRAKRLVRIGVDKLDQAQLNITLRYTMLRPVHFYQLLGGSPHTHRAHLERNVERGLLAKAITPVKAAADWNDMKSIRDTVANVYVITTEGRKHVQPWVPVGYPADTLLNMPPADRSRTQSDHQLGCVDLTAWYTRMGFKVVSEREIRSLEMDGVRGAGERRYPQPTGGPFWTVHVPGMIGVHPPDLGVIDTAGRRWGIELERATKEVSDYQGVIHAYRAAGLGQVWHIRSNATAERLREACERLGIELDPDQYVLRSADGLVRLQMWLPGASLSGLATKDWYIGNRVKQGKRTVVVDRWPAHIAKNPPGAIDAFEEQTDEMLAATWRRGRVDIRAVDPGLSEDGWW